MDFPKTKPYACLVRSERGKEELLHTANDLSKGSTFVLILKNDTAVAKRLFPAFVSSFVRYGERGMRSGSLQKEIMLFVAGTMNIGSAIKSVGVVSGDDFLVFASDRKLCSAFLEKIDGKKIKDVGLTLDKLIASEVATAGIKES